MPLITSARTHPVVRGIKIGSNQPPQWQSVPSPTFTLGTASNFPPSGTYQSNGYVTDANGDTITLTWISGSITGVTWDGGKFVYSGAGSAGTTGSLVLRANDGTDTVDSSAFSIVIESNLAWSTTPSVSFVEASVTPVNLDSYVTNYNASTDEFRVTPGYALPSWLALTPGPGIGSGNLTPNGTQVDANDIPASPGIKIDVRRSGGAWVSSAAFGVTVTAAPVFADTWTLLGTSAADGNWFWQTPVVRKDNGVLLIPGFGGTTKIWTPGVGFSSVSPTQWASAENWDIVHDDDNNRFWITGHNYGNWSGIAGRFADSDYGITSLVAAPTNAMGGANSGCGIALGKLIGFGGWSSNINLLRVTDLTTLVTNTYTATGTIPIQGQGPACERRGGVDSRTGQVWFFDINGDFHVCNGVLAGAPVWSKIPTYGTGPTLAETNNGHGELSYICELHEGMNTIVAWCGKKGWVTSDANAGITLGKAWALNLGTMVWREIGSTGGLPTSAVASYTAMLYDYANQRILVCVSGGATGSGTEVRALQLEGAEV